MNHSFAPLETRSDANDDPLAAATQAVEELRTASETFRTEQTAAAERQATETRALTERLAALETAAKRPANDNKKQEETPTEVRAFGGFIRGGREALPSEEVRALRVADDTAGGYLAPEQFEAVLLKELVEISPIRQASRVTQVASGSVVFPKRTGRLSAKWVGETEPRTGTEPTYGQVEIGVHEMACFVDVSNRLLEDSRINIEEELALDFAEEFGRLEAEAFVNGDGEKKPLGVMADPAIKMVANGHASQLQAAALLRLVYDLPQAYRNRGSFLMATSSIAAVRLLTDGNGRFLWQDSIQEGQPSTLFGRPVIEAPDMPDIAANATPIAYGDFGSGFRILDRVGLSVLRDPYTQQTNGLVRFHARRRVGAAVVRPDAIRKLRISTTLPTA